jgi:hypothetical protein
MNYYPGYTIETIDTLTILNYRAILKMSYVLEEEKARQFAFGVASATRVSFHGSAEDYQKAVSGWTGQQQ